MGKNARRRKEHRIIEKYGELPSEPKPFPGLKVVASILLVVMTGFAIRDLYRYGRPALKQWWSSAQADYAERQQARTTPTPEVKGEATTAPSTNPTTTTSETEKNNMIATMSTTMGDIKLELFSKEAPKTVENFVGLANKGYYNGVIFHRVIKDFMIQGGDPTGTGMGGESVFGTEFEDEQNGLQMDPGVIAMANRGPNTNGSQFFIVTEQRQSHLEGRHTIFGKVIEGMDVVKKIADVEVDGNDRPLQEVKITGIKVEEEK